MSERSESPDTTFARVAAEYARTPTPPGSPLFVQQEEEEALPSTEPAEPGPAAPASIRRNVAPPPARGDSIWSIPPSPSPLPNAMKPYSRESVDRMGLGGYTAETAPSRDSSATFGRPSETPGFDANAAAAGEMPPPKKKPGPEKGSEQKGTVFRMPENDSPDVYYGLSVRRDAFDKAHPDRKKVLVHVARIEETDEGMPRRGRCARCQSKGFHPCMVYTPDAIKQYGVKRCARCAYDAPREGCK